MLNFSFLIQSYSRISYEKLLQTNAVANDTLQVVNDKLRFLTFHLFAFSAYLFYFCIITLYNMNNKYLPIGIDLFFCIILLPAMMMMLPVDKWLESNSLFVITLIVWLYAVYFCIKQISVPMALKDRKHLLIAIAVLLGTIFITWLITQYQMDFPFRGHKPRMDKFIKKAMNITRIKQHQQGTWFMYLVTVCFSIAVGLLTELYKQIMARQASDFEKKKAELALYKAQINPHFLFNTLNTLYGLMITQSQKAETAFMQFIDLIKYMYTKATQDTVNIEEEAEYISQYIELQKNRIDEKRTHIYYSYSADESAKNTRIAPMILITFIENALKYGASSHIESDIIISLKVNNDTLTLFTENHTVNPKPENKEPGIGISNCKKRLELLYPGKHNLEISNTNGIFTVNLILKLK